MTIDKEEAVETALEVVKKLGNNELMEKLAEIHDISEFLGNVEDLLDTALFLGLVERVVALSIAYPEFTGEE